MNAIWGWSLAAGLALVLALAAWMIHPKGADTALPQGLPAPLAQTSPVTWVVLGSSLSTGTWPITTAARLSDCTGRMVTAQQITGPGRGSDWGLSQISAVIDARPDLVTIEFTINDADLRRGVSRAASRDNHLAMIAALRAALPDTRIVLLRLSRAHGLRAALRPLQTAYDVQLAQIAGQTGTGLIDLRPLWAKAPASDLPDGLHPTDAAATTRTAPALSKALAPLLGGSGC